jgi:hypothetical protein
MRPSLRLLSLLGDAAVTTPAVAAGRCGRHYARCRCRAHHTFPPRLLLLRPRRRNASRATCEAVLAILPTLRLACVRYSAAASALDIEALLARGIELPPREDAEEDEWLLAAASGAQWLVFRSRDT